MALNPFAGDSGRGNNPEKYEIHHASTVSVFSLCWMIADLQYSRLTCHHVNYFLKSFNLSLKK